MDKSSRDTIHNPYTELSYYIRDENTWSQNCFFLPVICPLGRTPLLSSLEGVVPLVGTRPQSLPVYCI